MFAGNPRFARWVCDFALMNKMTKRDAETHLDQLVADGVIHVTPGGGPGGSDLIQIFADAAEGAEPPEDAELESIH